MTGKPQMTSCSKYLKVWGIGEILGSEISGSGLQGFWGASDCRGLKPKSSLPPQELKP